jgi:hypothetical protein
LDRQTHDADKTKILEPPDTISISDFMLNEAYGRCSLEKSKNPFTCGLSGRTYSARDMVERVDHLSRALSKEFQWHPNKGAEWDKVIAIFALNTVCLAVPFQSPQV